MRYESFDKVWWPLARYADGHFRSSFVRMSPEGTEDNAVRPMLDVRCSIRLPSLMCTVYDPSRFECRWGNMRISVPHGWDSEGVVLPNFAPAPKSRSAFRCGMLNPHRLIPDRDRCGETLGRLSCARVWVTLLACQNPTSAAFPDWTQLTPLPACFPLRTKCDSTSKRACFTRVSFFLLLYKMLYGPVALRNSAPDHSSLSRRIEIACRPAGTLYATLRHGLLGRESFRSMSHPTCRARPMT